MFLQLSTTEVLKSLDGQSYSSKYVNVTQASFTPNLKPNQCLTTKVLLTIKIT